MKRQWKSWRIQAYGCALPFDLLIGKLESTTYTRKGKSNGTKYKQLNQTKLHLKRSTKK